jgi:hypothetical protein
MKSPSIRVCSILLILVLFGFLGGVLPSRGSQSTTDTWEVCTICETPARIALNASPGLALVPRRDIYLLIEASDFTEENLRKAFEKLAMAYPDPCFLGITAFSNREYLKQLIRAAEDSVIIDFADTPKGRIAEREYYSARYPPKNGYFRAYYLRSAIDRESFQYTPNPAEERTVQVILKTTTSTKD